MSDFQRYAPAMAVFYGAALFMAVIFGSVVLSGASPITVEVFGPIIYAAPAVVWPAAQVFLAALALIGAALKLPRVSAVGGFVLGAKFLFFAVAAIAAGATGTFLIAMAVPATGICWLSAFIAYRGRHGSR